MPLSEEEKEELKRLADSGEMRRDMQRMADSRRRAFLETGGVDTDRFLDFVSAFNQFINHAPRKFRRIEEHDMRF